MRLHKLSSMILAGAVVAFAVVAQGAVTIETVPIGNLGNANDLATGNLYGAVSYAYNIAKNETTIGQYAEFLNAVAATDTYNLYNTSMTDTQINGISQSGSIGSFTYSVAAGSGNKPITYVSWFDAARFSNWMHNGQPIGAQVAGTTERGAYTLDGATSGVSVSKNVGAKYWIPSENEWYKAAYYDPHKGGPGVSGYWLSPMQSDTLPAGNTVGVAHSANYWDGDYVGYPGMALTDVGAYGANSASFYGTNDQGGNVWEWNDAVIGSSRGLRGGAWNGPVYNLAASFSIDIYPAYETDLIGFRVASVPEPGSLIMLAGLALTALLYWVRKHA